MRADHPERGRMNIGCPHCLTRYQLPESLMGPGGARVTCPRCRQAFLVNPAGDVSVPAIASSPDAAPEAPVSPRRVAASATPPPAPPPALAPSTTAQPPAIASPRAMPAAPAPSTAPAAAPDVARGTEPETPRAGEATPIEIARRIVAQLHESHGREIESAVARGRVFSEHGVRIVDAFDSYRRAVGKGAVAGPFREALYERWGIDLTPHWERRPR
jgi:predicted Zn finger-like uncharacterized protein